MPIYEYVADQCRRQPPCAGRREYIQGVSSEPLSVCRECGAAIRRVFSSFAARSGAVGLSSPDPTGLNLTGIPAPPQMPSGGECGSDGHSH
jgi:putative FmdB family regulatory protein